MTQKHIEIEKSNKATTILLNRPEARNAMDPVMIKELIGAIRSIQADSAITVMVIRGKNGTFSSGADLNWMKESGSKTWDQNLAESRMISELMETLSLVTVPLISLVEGSVFGGALGILGCSDWVLAEENTLFGFSEVKLGLAPAVILPYLMFRSKSVKMKQLMLTGRKFDAWEALDIGLADQVGELKDMETELHELIQTFTNLTAGAVKAIKELWKISQPPVGQELSELTIQELSRLKQSTEARELLTRFLNKKI